jgi:hypothetical protein
MLESSALVAFVAVTDWTGPGSATSRRSACGYLSTATSRWCWTPMARCQDDGIWTAPSGDRVAWFADPDGNTLPLTQGG